MRRENKPVGGGYSARMERWPGTDLIELVARLRAGAGFLSVAREMLDAEAEASAIDDDALFPAAEAQSLDRVAAEAELLAWSASGYRVTPFWDVEFPMQLREIHEMPPLIWTRGTLLARDDGVCVVGTRNPSAKGRAYAATVATGLANRNITVVSGLAAGIDTVAHTAALDAGGRTVAGIGTGIAQTYPRDNATLQERIADSGLVLSQFWPTSSPTRVSFPIRNAVMSGYGRASVVVEAGEHSGTRTQGRLAVAHGRAVVLSEAVAVGTKWGRDLASRPGVTVAESAEHAIELASAAAWPIEETLRFLLPTIDA